jgi:hypothetical protein
VRQNVDAELDTMIKGADVVDKAMLARKSVSAFADGPCSDCTAVCRMAAMQSLPLMPSALFGGTTVHCAAELPPPSPAFAT